MTKLKIALIQISSGSDWDLNLEKSLSLSLEAAKSGAKLIIWPENALYLGLKETDKIEKAVDLNSSWSEKIKEFCKSSKTAIIVGSIPEKIPGTNKTYNTLVVFNQDGDLVEFYRKIHLFDVKLSKTESLLESSSVEAGKEIKIVDICNWKIGLSICYDLRFPWLYRKLVRSGAELLIVPAAFTATTGQDHWEVLLRARAIENFCYVAAPNQTGQHNERRSSYGHSMIIHPWGHLQASMGKDEGFLVTEIDKAALDKSRSKIPVLEHDFNGYE